ncbi:dCTP deaminase [Shinella sp.]|uniref:dCTP deaminase n=1 Tax=Shinella sp. TaxID=1870904 RepID=UPI003D2BD258
MLSASRIIELLELSKTDPEKGLSCCPMPDGVLRNQVGPASLDLRLGCWFLILQQSRRSEIDLSKKNIKPIEDTDGKYYYVPFGQKFVIHPGRFVLGATLEWLRMPANIGGYITGKSSLGRRGLIIETAAGIHPGFKGCLTLEMYNCGEVPIAITPGMRISQVFFHGIDSVNTEIESKFGGKRKPVFGTFDLDCDSGNMQERLID